MRSEAIGEAALAVAFLGVAGDGDEEGIGEGRFGAEDAGDFVAVEAGQAEVEEQRGGEEFAGGGHGVGAGVGAAHFAVAPLQEAPERLGGVFVVVHDEDAHGLRQGGAVGRRRGWGGGFRLDQERQAHRDGRAGIRTGAFDRDATEVHFDERFHHTEANAEAAQGAVEGAVGLAEKVEDVRQEVGGNTHAVVRDGDHHFTVFVLRPDGNAAVVRRVFCGIAQEIHKDLLEPRGVSGDAELAPDGAREAVPPLHEERPRYGDRALQHGDEIERFHAQLDAPAIDARHVEEIVHHPGKLLALVVDHVRGPPGAFQVPGPLVADLHRVPDGVERVAQLMTEHGEEFVLPLRFLADRLFRLFPFGDVQVRPRHPFRLPGGIFADRLHRLNSAALAVTAPPDAKFPAALPGTADGLLEDGLILRQILGQHRTAPVLVMHEPIRRGLDAVDAEHQRIPVDRVRNDVPFPDADAGGFGGEVHALLPRGFGFLAHGDVRADGHVLPRLPVFIEEGDDGCREPIKAAILRAIADVALPHFPALDRRPEVAEELLRMSAGIDDAMILSQ